MAPAMMPSPAAIATIHSSTLTAECAFGPTWISIQAPACSTSATSPRSTPTPSAMISTIASAIDLTSSARNGGEAIWASALVAASSISEPPPTCGKPVARLGQRAVLRNPGPSPDYASLHPGYQRTVISAGGGAALRRPGRRRDRRRLRVFDRDRIGARQIGPVHLFVIEAALECRFDHGEIRRNVEIARRVERGMPDLENLPARRAALDAGDLGQDRIAHELESLGDQSRADQPGRVAGSERDHPPAPAPRHRQRHQIAQQV